MTTERERIEHEIERAIEEDAPRDVYERLLDERDALWQGPPATTPKKAEPRFEPREDFEDLDDDALATHREDALIAREEAQDRARQYGDSARGRRAAEEFNEAGLEAGRADAALTRRREAASIEAFRAKHLDRVAERLTLESWNPADDKDIRTARALAEEGKATEDQVANLEAERRATWFAAQREKAARDLVKSAQNIAVGEIGGVPYAMSGPNIDQHGVKPPPAPRSGPVGGLFGQVIETEETGVA